MYPTFPQSSACGFFSQSCLWQVGVGIGVWTHFPQQGTSSPIPFKAGFGQLFILVWFVFGWPARGSSSKLGCKQALAGLPQGPAASFANNL